MPDNGVGPLSVPDRWLVALDVDALRVALLEAAAVVDEAELDAGGFAVA